MKTRTRIPAAMSAIALLLSLLVMVASLPVSAAQIGAGAPVRGKHQSCPSSPTEVHAITGYLHTCDGLILDSKDRLVRLTALEFGGLGVGDNDTDTPPQCRNPVPPRDYAAQDVAKWGFNSVELMISWQNLEPDAPVVNADGTVTHFWDSSYLETLDNTIKSFTDQGIAVVLMMVQSRWSTAFRELHWDDHYQACGFGMPNWLYPQGGSLSAMIDAELDFFHNVDHVQGGLVAAWKMVAARYQDNPLVVGAVPLTESYDVLAVQFPGTENLRPKDFRLTAFYTKIGKAIHAANPNLLIIFWDQKSIFTKLYAVKRKPQFANEVYGAEFYSSNWAKGEPRLAGYSNRASSWGLPFTMGEFTMFNYTISSSPFPNWEDNSKSVLDYAREHHIGWAICCYGTGSFMDESDPHKPKDGILPILQDHGF